MNARVQQAQLNDLEEMLGLFDSVQIWLLARGLKEQWGSAPFSASEVQRQRFAAWLSAGHLFVVRGKGQIIGTLVFSPEPPDYARNACAGRIPGGYLEAFAVHRDYAGQGVGCALLAWAEQEAVTRGLDVLRLDCWAENDALRAYYRRAGFSETALLTLGAWRGVMFRRFKAPSWRVNL